MRDYPEFENPQQRPRYTGLPTFMRTPYREDMEGLDIALVGIPFDGGVTNRTGARHGTKGNPESVFIDEDDQPGYRDQSL